MAPTLAVMLSFVTILFLSLGAYLVARRTKLPYTVLLVVVGFLLIPLSKLPVLNFITSFSLTPDLLFFVFLPTLIFESAYNMNARKMVESIRSISLLSIISLFISTIFIAFALYYTSLWVGFPIPFIVTLIFGALISATDPVAVLALFKEYGVPKRLSLIFEGESLFNDGTSLALFLVVLEIAIAGWNGVSSVSEGIFLFITMVFGGILFGGLMGVLFSKIIERVKNNEYVEISLTMIVAHFTFIFSELLSHGLMLAGHEIKFSSIIATVISAMIVGNYGRYKISPRVAEFMEKFWGYCAFIVNSVIFILIGLLFASLAIKLREIMVPVLLTIVIVMIGRALSIYPVIGILNRTKREEHIPMNWQHLLAWGSLRGALAVTMVLLIPNDLTVAGWDYDFSVKDFITALTIACIYFTLFIKATTIGPMIRKLRIDAFSPIEEVEYSEGKALIYAKVLIEIERFKLKGYITEDNHVALKTKYEKLYKVACDACTNAVTANPSLPKRMITMYATGIEKGYLHKLFYYGEVSELVYKKILGELHERREIAEQIDTELIIAAKDFKKDWYENAGDSLMKLGGRFVHVDPEDKTLYMYYRARAIIARKVTDELATLRESSISIFSNKETIENILRRYEHLYLWASQKEQDLLNAHQQLLKPVALAFAEAGIFKAEESILFDLESKEVFSPKVSTHLEDHLILHTQRAAEELHIVSHMPERV